jgi:hypothetical protein
VYGGPFAAAMRETLLLEDDRGISFVSSHATLDAQHMAQLREVLNLVEEADAHSAIVESVLFNFHHITNVFGSV